MADITPTSNSWPYPYRTPWGAAHTVSYRESTAQSFRLGYLLQSDTAVSTSAHRVVTASTLSTALIGIAAEKASSAIDTFIPVWEANPMTEFVWQTKEALASTMIGAARSIGFDSTLNIYYINANSSEAEARLTITGFFDAIGDTNGRVIARFRREGVRASSNSTVSASLLTNYK